MKLTESFERVFGVWEPALPYISDLFTKLEMKLLVVLDGQTVSAAQAGEYLDMEVTQAQDLLESMYRRELLDKSVLQDEQVSYTPTSFPVYLDWLAKYGPWDELPADVRAALDRQFLDEFVTRHRENIARKCAGLTADNAMPNDTVMLLPEVEAMLRAAELIVVQPCDCRRLGGNCERPVETCIWLDEGARTAQARGHGRVLSQVEAIELVSWADRKGLMHTADSDWQTSGLHAICNCCACDCYPIRAAQELGSKSVWPRSRYLAVHDQETCSQCGACVRRCHFEAFSFSRAVVEVQRRSRQLVVYDADRCWGCGLCANTCPEGAIQMQALSLIPE